MWTQETLPQRVRQGLSLPAHEQQHLAVVAAIHDTNTDMGEPGVENAGPVPRAVHERSMGAAHRAIDGNVLTGGPARPDRRDPVE